MTIFSKSTKFFSEIFNRKDPLIIAEQWTGLVDCNEVDVYDGDILNYTVFDMNDNDTQFKGVVKWVGCGFIITQIPDSLSNGEYGLELYWVAQQDCELEVIGNIHKNPELIKN